jgi:hypothetical protein
MDLQVELNEAIKQAKILRQAQKAFIKRNHNEMIRITDALGVIGPWLISIRFDGALSLDVRISGDNVAFKTMFSAMRKAGYVCGRRPKELVFASWSSYFEHPDTELRIWISFSSTQCKRKVIGTEMVEQPLYETVCE